MSGRHSSPVPWRESRSGKLHLYPAHRVCERNLCLTVLSIYNASAYCSVHEPWTRATGSMPRR